MARVIGASNGTVSYFHKDTDGSVVLGQRADVEPLLNENKRLQSLNDGYNPAKDLRRVASVHPVVLLKWLREAGISVPEFQRNTRRYSAWLRKKIYDKDNEMFLTAPHYRNRRSNGVQVHNPGLDSALAEGRKLGMEKVA